MALHDAQQAMLAVFYNLPFPLTAKLLRGFMFPFGKPYAPPSDTLIHQVATLALAPSSSRDRLTAGIYITDDPTDRTGRIEYAFKQAIAAEAAEKKLKKIRKQGKLTSYIPIEQIAEAAKKNLISTQEANQLHNAWQAMREAIRVDSFDNI
jgi:acyl-CoA dehydrogenase